MAKIKVKQIKSRIGAQHIHVAVSVEVLVLD